MAREMFAFDQSNSGREQAGRASALASLQRHDLMQSISLNRQLSCQHVGNEPTKYGRASAPTRNLLWVAPGIEQASAVNIQDKTSSVQISPAQMQAELEEIPVQAIYRVVRSLMEREQVFLARKILDALPLGRLADPAIARLRNLIAAPMTRASQKRDTDRASDFDWIRKHAQEYSGQWVALLNGQLLASAVSLRDLLGQVNSLGLNQRPLLHQISS